MSQLSYKYLKIGDTIKEGDEIFDEWDKDNPGFWRLWHGGEWTLDTTHWKFRRPIIIEESIIL